MKFWYNIIWSMIKRPQLRPFVSRSGDLHKRRVSIYINKKSQVGPLFQSLICNSGTKIYSYITMANSSE
jgi:hypothetical protein